MGYTDREDDADDLDERDDPLEDDMDSTDEWDPDVEQEQRKRPWVIVTTIVVLVVILLGVVFW